MLQRMVRVNYTQNMAGAVATDVKLVRHEYGVSLATKITPEVQALVCERLEQTGNVSEAADCAGVSRNALYELRARDPAFDAACQEALERATDRLERKVRARAENGTKRGVWYKGEKVGEERETHDVLSMFMLKAHRPHVYRQDVAVQIGLSVAHTASMSDQQLEALVARQLRDEHVIDANTFNVIKGKAQLSTNMQESAECDATTIDAVQRSVVYGDKGPESARRGGGGPVARVKGDPKEEHRRASPRRKRKAVKKQFSKYSKKRPR
jgi:hypothetical protein